MLAEPTARDQPGIAWLPLAIGLGVMVSMSVMPGLVANSSGEADHVAALLLFWAMSAGFVRGVGYVPENRVPRWFLSGPACLAALAAAFLRLVAGHGLLLTGST